jgi:hypothetical protein
MIGGMTLAGRHGWQCDGIVGGMTLVVWAPDYEK